MQDPLVIGRMLRQIRERCGLSRAQLAKEAHCSVDTVKKIEIGCRRPSMDMAQALARALDWAPGTEEFIDMVQPTNALSAVFYRRDEEPEKFKDFLRDTRISEICVVGQTLSGLVDTYKDSIREVAMSGKKFRFVVMDLASKGVLLAASNSRGNEDPRE